MSSKAARLRRRQAARRNRSKRLRKSGRVPQHTRAERRREAAELQRWQEAEERRRKWQRRTLPLVVAPIGAASFVFMPLAGLSSGHLPYQYLSAAAPAGAANPDLPHTPEPGGTFYSPLVAAGTTRTIVLVGPVPSEIWNGSERYGSYGPNIFGE